MTFVQNGIDEVRRTARMSIDSANNGGSFVELANQDTYGIENKSKFELTYRSLTDINQKAHRLRFNTDYCLG